MLSSLQYLQHRVEHTPPDENELVNEKVSYSKGSVSYRSANEEFAGKMFVEYATKIDRFPDGFYDLVAVVGLARSSCLFYALKKVNRGEYLLLDNGEWE